MISIIAILSSLVLSSLASARTKARIVSVESTMSSLRTQAEIFYSENNTYENLCNDDEIVRMINQMIEKGFNANTHDPNGNEETDIFEVCNSSPPSAPVPYKDSYIIVGTIENYDYSTPAVGVHCVDSEQNFAKLIMPNNFFIPSSVYAHEQHKCALP